MARNGSINMDSGRKHSLKNQHRLRREKFQAPPAPNGWGSVSFHGKRVCQHGQTGLCDSWAEGHRVATLLVSHLGAHRPCKLLFWHPAGCDSQIWHVTAQRPLACEHKAEIAGWDGAALRVMLAGFFQAECAVDSQANIGSVFVFLAVILPPANRAQPHRTRGLQGLVSAAWASKKGFHQIPHGK